MVVPFYDKDVLASEAYGCMIPGRLLAYLEVPMPLPPRWRVPIYKRLSSNDVNRANDLDTIDTHMYREFELVQWPKRCYVEVL